MIFHVTVQQGEDGQIVVSCPALPGCISQGADVQSALENIREAIALYLWEQNKQAVATLGEEERSTLRTVTL